MNLRLIPSKLLDHTLLIPNTLVGVVDHRTIPRSIETAMSSTGAEKSQPPSPLLSNAQELPNEKDYQYGLHHLAPNHSALPYRQDSYLHGNTGYMAPPSNTTWSSPESYQIDIDPNSQDPYQGANYHQGVDYRQAVSTLHPERCKMVLSPF